MVVAGHHTATPIVELHGQAWVTSHRTHRVGVIATPPSDPEAGSPPEGGGKAQEALLSSAALGSSHHSLATPFFLLSSIANLILVSSRPPGAATVELASRPKAHCRDSYVRSVGTEPLADLDHWPPAARGPGRALSTCAGPTNHGATPVRPSPHWWVVGRRVLASTGGQVPRELASSAAAMRCEAAGPLLLQQPRDSLENAHASLRRGGRQQPLRVTLPLLRGVREVMNIMRIS